MFSILKLLVGASCNLQIETDTGELVLKASLVEEDQNTVTFELRTTETSAKLSFHKSQMQEICIENVGGTVVYTFVASNFLSPLSGDLIYV